MRFDIMGGKVGTINVWLIFKDRGVVGQSFAMVFIVVDNMDFVSAYLIENDCTRVAKSKIPSSMDLLLLIPGNMTNTALFVSVLHVFCIIRSLYTQCK